MQHFVVCVCTRDQVSMLVKGTGVALSIFNKKKKKIVSTRLEDLVYVCSNLKLALSSVPKDSSSSSQPWFRPIPSTNEDDLGIDGDTSDA